MGNIFQNEYFWFFIGALLATLFGILQQVSLKNIDPNLAQQVLSTAMFFSAIRILISLFVLFLAFKTGVINGLCCLFAFIIARWVWLIILVKKRKNGI